MNDAADKMADQIHGELTQLLMKYDTKLLATAMLLRSTAALRALHSTGVWQIKDVQDVVDFALEDIYTPLPSKDLPQVAHQTVAVLQ